MSNWNDDRLDRRDEEMKEGFTRLETQIKGSIAASERRSAALEEQIKESIAASERRSAALEAQIKESAAANERRSAGLEEQIKESIAASERRFEKVDERLVQTTTRQELKDGTAELRSEMNKGFTEMSAAYTGLMRTLLLSAVTIVVTLLGILGTQLG